jgi:glutathione synthase/RimK-type ligase-like ATP-grasp enzyme
MAVGIFTFAEDLHGHLVADYIRQRGLRCHIVATDRLAHSPFLSWSSHGDAAAIRDIEGTVVDPAQFTTVWWRRVMGPMDLGGSTDEASRNLIPAEVRAALAGAVLSRFTGKWVNDPAAEIRADNKLVQLTAARAAGLAVPETLVSSDPERIRAFLAAHGGRAVVKVVRGTAAFSIPTRLVTDADLASTAALQACPAIYQTVVDGIVHLRIHVFGEAIVAVRIESQRLDWRTDLTVPMEVVTLERSLAGRLVGLIRDLGLAMGIIDAKIADDGTPVFLEVNPQGQFLFIEGLINAPLATTMAALLITSL